MHFDVQLIDRLITSYIGSLVVYVYEVTLFRYIIKFGSFDVLSTANKNQYMHILS